MNLIIIFEVNKTNVSIIDQNNQLRISLFFKGICQSSSRCYNLCLISRILLCLLLIDLVVYSHIMDALCRKSCLMKVLLLHLILLLETDFVVQSTGLEWSFCSACFAFSCQKVIGCSFKPCLFSHESWGIVRMLEIDKSTSEIRLGAKSRSFL